jgi:hypothetical protein
MLLSMQQPTPEPLSRFSPSFAGSLAEIVSPEKKFPPARDLDGLADDVAVFSYEQALRIQSRSHPVRPAIAPKADAAPGDASGRCILTPRTETIPSFGKCAPSPAASAFQAAGRRHSSVTIRLSAQESEQLHLRAVEAGLTVSAYLRSCALEVENLRTEVKATLAQLRSQSVSSQPVSPESNPQTNSESNPVSPVPHRLLIRSWLRSLLGFLTRPTRLKPQA